MWQERLPRELGDTAPAQSLGMVVGHLMGRLLFGAGLLAVVAAVVLGSFGFAPLGKLLGAVVVLGVVALAAEPLWHRTRRRASSWWR